jgi:DNA-binding GntR family transcriptional regulator
MNKASDAPTQRFKRAQGFGEEIFEIIRADIMSLKIPPNTRISIDNLAKELGVSQTPIREALSMLEALGLVTRKQFSGYCTAPKLNRKEFEELYEIRLLLEPYAARCAAKRMDDEALAEICELARRTEPGKSESQASFRISADDDSELHAKIALGSKNRLIEDSLSRLHTHLHLFRLHFPGKVDSEVFAEHVRLVDALKRRNPREAEAAMRAHIKNSHARLIQFTE